MSKIVFICLIEAFIASFLIGCVERKVDESLRLKIEELELTGDASLSRQLPSIDSPLAQLGKKLFFSKSLGGGFDSACVSCHHPMLGGADGISLSVGVGAIDPDLLGPGRVSIDGKFAVPRNAPTVFNVGLYDSGLFWDSRVESLGKESKANGASSGIRTPNSDFGVADPLAGSNLVAAQARFPVTSAAEMKTEEFETDSDNSQIRYHLAARLGGYCIGSGELDKNEWLQEFQAAFGVDSGPEDLITFDNIALAISEYERSMVFTANPWSAYVQGDEDAIDLEAKNGAIAFLTPVSEGGAGCVSCHSGDLMSDERHHTLAIPQIGPGKSNGTNGDDDFGRVRETRLEVDLYRFRTPSLLNVSLTAPYGHSGAYQSLRDVIKHHLSPRQSIANYFIGQKWCELPQFKEIPNCDSLFPNAESNTLKALAKLEQEINEGRSDLLPTDLPDSMVDALVAFMNSLTDPCAASRSCLSPWIPSVDELGPDSTQLNAVNLARELM